MAAMIENLRWMVWAGGFISFACSFGIGANDVANSFATSVGAKSLTLRQAVMVASIFEFCGAFLMGSHVTGTIRKSIVDGDIFDDRPEILMLVMLCALIGTTCWLILATRFALPVSTTHTIVGGIIGPSIVYAGTQSVQWTKVWIIVASWVASPLLSGLIGGSLFRLVRRFILRKENSLQLSFRFYPVLISFTLAINIFFVVFKGTPALDLDSTPLWLGLLVSLGTGMVLGGLAHVFLVPIIRKQVESRARAKTDTSNQVAAAVPSSPHNEEVISDDVSVEVQQATTPEGPAHNSGSRSSKSESFPKKPAILSHLNRDVVGMAYEKHDNLAKLHSVSETFDPQTERLFSYLQVFTAVFDSFAHGSNDVANSIAPLAAIYGVYSTGSLSDSTDVPLWILALGGSGLVVGLMVWGWRIIEAIGVRLTKMTPSRGVAVELGASLVVVCASRAGLPVSTTHSQVGATVAIGLADGKAAINWPLMLRTAIGWIATLAASGLVSASLFALIAYSPTLLM